MKYFPDMVKCICPDQLSVFLTVCLQYAGCRGGNRKWGWPPADRWSPPSVATFTTSNTNACPSALAVCSSIPGYGQGFQPCMGFQNAPFVQCDPQLLHCMSCPICPGAIVLTELSSYWRLAQRLRLTYYYLNCVIMAAASQAFPALCSPSAPLHQWCHSRTMKQQSGQNTDGQSPLQNMSELREMNQSWS